MTKTFDVRLLCSNCGKFSVFEFPFGTDINRLPYGQGTVARIPQDEAPEWRLEIVFCPRCGSKKIG